MPRPAPRAEDGFTLVELIAAMAIGLVISAAAMTLTVVAYRSQARVEDRIDATQRGRTAMNAIVGPLRSQVCVGAAKPITQASATSLTYTTQLTLRKSAAVDPTQANVASFQPEIRRVRLVPGAGGEATIYEDRWTSTGSPPVFAATPTTKVLIDQVRATSLFGYAKLDETTGAQVALPATVPAAQLAAIRLVDVSFDALAGSARRGSASAFVPFANSVLSRYADC